MSKRIQQGGLQIAPVLYQLVEEIVPGTGFDSEQFWAAFEEVLNELSVKNRALLTKRAEIQRSIDQWHQSHKGANFDYTAYKQMLLDIGYLKPEGEDFSITTSNIDAEISTIAGPQLVVPIKNARFALNAANARWGSLYDALYGTDVISDEGGAEKVGAYNPKRGAKVINYAKNFLDQSIPLAKGSHHDASAYFVENGNLLVTVAGENIALKSPVKFVGYQGEAKAPKAVLLVNNNLHIEIQIDAANPIGQTDSAHVKDVLLESAITTIQDCEDSVAAVDAEDKVEVYRNWFGLIKGDLKETFKKGGKDLTRKLNPDRTYSNREGKEITLPGRSLLLVRNVGHLMTNDAVLDKNNEEVPEGIMDGLITALIYKHQLNGNVKLNNSRTGSMYIVKPKMHGPEEVAFTNELFSRIEDVLQIKRNTLKMGIMDEERRTTVNLKECIRQAKERVIFINTGFLDRTGDEIHTSMQAGPVVKKGPMKAEKWINSYEDWNVDIGLKCGLKGKAQIGKGMWPKPDEMLEMMEAKIDHPRAGANCSWVPSPTAATLHVMHYHQVNVAEVQESLVGQTRASLDDILQIPVATDTNFSKEEIEQELENNAQGILGYVVRWIDSGVGCSKVPDINDVGLMEDRATLRISSQHIANWIKHGICSEEEVMTVMKQMAKVVDRQNEGDPAYIKMSDNFEDNVAFHAACDLVFKGADQPSGYTEPLLHARRKEFKQKHTVA